MSVHKIAHTPHVYLDKRPLDNCAIQQLIVESDFFAYHAWRKYAKQPVQCRRLKTAITDPIFYYNCFIKR
jgi:hypothetical protein